MNAASQWRIDLGRDLARPYVEGGASIAMVTGSASRGLADDWSDLDLVVVWDEPDRDLLEAAPLARFGGRRYTNHVSEDGGGVEQYTLGTLKVDVGSMARAGLDEVIRSVHEDHDTSWPAQKVCCGFSDGVAIHGDEELADIRRRLSAYPDGLVEAVVRANLPFLPRWAPERMGADRHDRVAYLDLVLSHVKKAIGVLAGVNRRYWSTTPEAKWSEWFLQTCAVVPPGAAHRVQEVLASPPAEALDDLYRFLDEVLDLVDAHAPFVPTARAREILTMPLAPSEAPPPLG